MTIDLVLPVEVTLVAICARGLNPKFSLSLLFQYNNSKEISKWTVDIALKYDTWSKIITELSAISGNELFYNCFKETIIQGIESCGATTRKHS